MAQLVLGVVGAGIGAAFGDPQLGFSIGVLLGGALFPPKQARQSRGRLDDLKVTGSAYGAMIPQVYGCYRLGGNIIWATDLVEHSSIKKQGGKGAPKQSVKEYTYSVSMLVLICEGEVGSFERVWLEDKLIYDPAGKSGTVIPLPDYMTLFYGTEEQMPWSVMEADALIGVGNAPAHRGHAMVGFEDLDCSPYGNRVPMVRVEVCPAAGFPTDDMLWDFNAADITGLVNGQNVLLFEDSSGNDYDAIDTPSGSPATYLVSGINGHPAVQVAAGQGFDIPFGTISPAVTSDDLTLYLVTEATHPQAGNAILLQVYEDPEITIGMDLPVNFYGGGVPPVVSIGVETTDLTGFNRQHTTVPVTTGQSIWAFVLEKAADTCTVYRNGVVVAQSSSDFQAFTHTFGDDTIELFHFAGAAQYVCKFGRFTAYAAAHSPTTVSDTTDLLNAFWGIF